MSYERNALNLANHCAEMSCERWNSSSWEPKTKFGKAIKAGIIDKIYQLSRSFYRNRYWEMSDVVRESTERQMWVNILKRSPNSCLNTYPWPYASHGFANWVPEPDTSVLDPSGLVVKTCTSYCAWKICELKGKWPKVKNLIHEIQPKNWQYYLMLLGYDEIVEAPEPGHHYVGIDPHFDDHGIVVWYERKSVKGGVVFTTYRDREFHAGVIKEENVNLHIWIRID